MEIRALRPSDDRATFRSGDPDLDSFFQKYAAQNQFRHHIGTTYVAVEADRMLGFVTVAPGQIESERIPHALRRRLPRYPLPVLRVARLAVDSSVRSRGIGSALLRFALRLALRLGDEFGCAGVLVDAKPAAVEFYNRLGFMPLDLIEGESSVRPIPATMFLPLGEIRAASRPR